MILENLTINFLKEAYEKANTNATFKLWAKTYIRRTYNIDALSADVVFDVISNN